MTFTDRRGTTFATIGQGSVKINGAEATAEQLAGINRDITTREIITKNENGKYSVYVPIINPEEFGKSVDRIAKTKDDVVKDLSDLIDSFGSQDPKAINVINNLKQDVDSGNLSLEKVSQVEEFTKGLLKKNPLNLTPCGDGSVDMCYKLPVGALEALEKGEMIIDQYGNFIYKDDRVRLEPVNYSIIRIPIKMLAAAISALIAKKAGEDAAIIYNKIEKDQAEPSDRPDIEKELKKADSDRTIGKTTSGGKRVDDGSGAKQYEKGGGFDQAKKEFEDMGLSDIKEYPNGTIVGVLPDGTRVNVRPDSSKGKDYPDGVPTIEIQRGKGIKIRYLE